jgi:polyhydroxybutyrate depolymerase
MQNGARRYGYEKKWSEAVVMYPQGLPTVTRRDPEGKRSGWNSMAVGRDVRFVEDMLKWVKSNRKIGKVFIAGHSNGGGFVYGLWRAMPKEFSGVASYAATGQPSPRIGSIPLFHLSGRKDETVKFDEQVSTVQRLVTQFGSSQDSSPKDGLTTFKGSTHELRWYVHAGGHELPEKGIDLTIEFFKELARK